MTHTGDYADAGLMELVSRPSPGRTLAREDMDRLVSHAEAAAARPRPVFPEFTRPGLAVPDWQLDCLPRVEEVPYHGPPGECGMVRVVTSSFPMVERAARFGGHTVPVFYRPGS